MHRSFAQLLRVMPAAVLVACAGCTAEGTADPEPTLGLDEADAGAADDMTLHEDASLPPAAMADAAMTHPAIPSAKVGVTLPHKPVSVTDAPAAHAAAAAPTPRSTHVRRGESEQK